MKIVVIKVTRQVFHPKLPIDVTVTIFNKDGTPRFTIPLPAKLFPNDVKEQDTLVFAKEFVDEILVSENTITHKIQG